MTIVTRWSTQTGGSPAPPRRGVGPGLRFGGDVEVGAAMPGTATPVPEIVGEVAAEESGRALLVELAHVDEFVGQEFPVAAAVAVLAQQDDPSEGHPVGAVGQERDLDDPHPRGDLLGEDVVGDQFGALETTHGPRVRGRSSPGDGAVVSEHYGRVEDLTQAILDGLGGAPVTIDALAPVDEFHLGGTAATEALVADLGLGPDDHVLDLGSGIGGPARRMAATAGCRVRGIDLTPSFVATAEDLSRLTGSGERTSFAVADATALTGDERYTAATLVHVGMNIPDKAALFASVAAHLEPGARFGVYDIMVVGDAGEIRYPMPFASGPDQAFLAAPEEYVTALRAAGFEVGEPIDRTGLALEVAAAATAAGPPPVSLATLMGPDFATMFGNLGAALRARRLAPVQIIATR